MNEARAYHAAVQPANGQVLVVGGQGNNSQYSLPSAELYNPKTGKWSRTGNMSTTRADLTIARFANGQVLVAGGVDNGDNPSLASAELYTPGVTSVGRPMASDSGD